MSLRQLFVLACLGAVPACVTGPHNGTTTDAPSVIGKTFNFQGYYNEPNVTIRLQVLSTPTSDPTVDGNWIQFATATTSTTETKTKDDEDPLYYWSVTAAPVPNGFAALRWPQGGLVRLRAIKNNSDGTKRVVTTFDDVTFDDCFTEHYSEGWMAIGQECAGVGNGHTRLVSTTNIPVLPGSPNAPGALKGFLGKKGEITPSDTQFYYIGINAPGTLHAFKDKYDFPTNEVTATYYNDGDLGLGREMHCKQFWNFSTSTLGLACYVTNYSGTQDPACAGQSTCDGIPDFGVNPTTVLADAVAKKHSFATVAMVYDGPAGAANSVKFMVYDANGELATEAQLDDSQNNKSIPNNCLSCHGISSNFTPGNPPFSWGSVSGNAKFLPFDPFSFKYSTAAGFTFAAQADEMRRLNAMVRMANPSPGITEYIDGLYAPKSVNDSTAVANPDYTPADWANANGSIAGTTIYQGVVRVACRTCHMSSISSSLDFADADDFSQFSGAIRSEVCDPANRQMPHAEHVMKKFWQSGARAYLMSAYGNSGADPLGACKP